MLFNSLEKLKDLFKVINYTNNLEVNTFQFDSRLIKKGDVFVALKAERDGHDFIESAMQKGAIAAIVEDEKPELNIPQFVTNNTWKALDLIAQKSRLEYKGNTIGVTGSCGKTTVKQMLAHGLENNYATAGNFNGLLGLPITLAHLDQNADNAILELGTDEIGNINMLTDMAKPNIAIVTSVGPAHLEMFKTISNIVDEKLSIANGLTDGGTFIIPHEYLTKAQNINDKTILTFSLNDTNATSYVEDTIDSTIKAVINGTKVEFNLPDTASHKVINALIFLTTLNVLNVDSTTAINKLESFKAPAGRGEQTQLANGVTLFDESYNANPLSMKKALESFKNLSKQKRIAILGDMLELGPDEILMHKQIANFCDSLDIIYTTGPLMESLYDELVNKKVNAKHFANSNELVEFLKTQEFKDCDIFIKGSKGSQVSKAVELLKS